MSKKGQEMVTPRQYSKLHEVAYTTLMGWLRQGLIEGAIREENPYGVGYYYKLPRNAEMPKLKPGPKPKSQATDETQGDASVEPTKKSASSRKLKTNAEKRARPVKMLRKIMTSSKKEGGTK